MHKIQITVYFSAAHFLRGYKGKCENLHGHNWKVEVMVSRPSLDSLGMIMDFGDLKKEVEGMLEKLDHRNVNDLDYFSAGKGHNPSSENIARYVFRELKKEIARRNCKLEEVRVWETENSCALYQE